jgi:hypothetical protein
MKFIKVTSKMASQKTTASWTPGKWQVRNTIEALRMTASGALMQVRYKGFCRFDSLKPLGWWCSTVTGNHTGTLLQACKGVLYFILFDKIHAGYVTEGGEGNILRAPAGQPSTTF